MLLVGKLQVFLPLRRQRLALRGSHGMVWMIVLLIVVRVKMMVRQTGGRGCRVGIWCWMMRFRRDLTVRLSIKVVFVGVQFLELIRIVLRVLTWRYLLYKGVVIRLMTRRIVLGGMLAILLTLRRRICLRIVNLITLTMIMIKGFVVLRLTLLMES